MNITLNDKEHRLVCKMNARLIAAAPELLEWLKKMLAEVDAGNGETPETSRWQEAHAVIAKTDIPT
jgi:hypothetical protein